MILEIRTYRIKPGAEEIFLRAMAEEAVPLLGKAGIDVVRCGMSDVEEDGRRDAYLMRAFSSVEQLAEQEDAFYSSEAWHQGPREAVLGSLDAYHSVAIELSEQAVDALRSGA